MTLLRISGVIGALVLSFSVFSQSADVESVKEYMVSQERKDALDKSDLGQLEVTDSHISKHNGITHVYLSQVFNGYRIMNSSITAVIDKDGEVLNATTRGIKMLGKLKASGSQSVSLTDAVRGQLSSLAPEIRVSELRMEGSADNEFTLYIEGDGYSHESHAELGYWATREGELIMAWKFDLDLEKQGHWWELVIDATNGSELSRVDWQTECSATHTSHGSHSHAITSVAAASSDGSAYRVFPLPVESPIHGSRELVNEPFDETASPFGWHDNNGVSGAEFTNTRGNNVHAYEDQDDDDLPGYSPDGGAALNFDFSLDLSDQPDDYLDAAITNLFYANNMIHDILYAYGFDEESGNFQENNYGNGGDENDYLNAEAQDGGGTNNANMATPPDGSNPRMQMYLWTGGAQSLLTINDPSFLAGDYVSSPPAAFGPDIPAGGITADVVIGSDGVGPDEYDVCEGISNPGELSGKIAIVNRGTCLFTEKVSAAQDAGALAVIVVNNEPNGVINMGGTDPSIAIPSIMVTQADGNDLIDAIEEGETVNATLSGEPDGSSILDASFDNGIIVHEYIHGLTNRLTGGANTSSCLSNEEQMGEGWSDWYALMLTMDMESENPVYRPMGTFANGEQPDGNGIRPVPYDTSFAVNDFTYADLPNTNLSIPHGVGFVWSTMLWDLTWALIDEYGFDPDLQNGDAGNTLALQLVTDALKLQPCSPGFVDGRDAILLADEINNDGANKCLIWEVFANRGLGFSAEQGSTESRSDGQAAFDLPILCQNAENPPIASFSASETSTCNGLVQFTDESTNLPQGWFWEFGDGETSTEQNPSHQYEEPGNYTVTLSVTNTEGDDQITQEEYITYELPDAPSAEDVEGCIGGEVSLTASAPEGSVIWLNSGLEQVGSGDTFPVTLNDSPETYYAQTEVNGIPETFVGPEDESFGSGGLHGTEFVGTVNLETYQPVIIRSAYVNSGSTGPRTITLWSGASGSGEVIDQVTVDIDFTGWDRIDLNFELNEPGEYSFGLAQADLYRNNSGADYPYTEEGLISITGSSAGQQFYYYFYDLEIEVPSCLSDPVEVTATPVAPPVLDYEVSELTVDFSGDSEIASDWFWDFGDGETSSEQNPEHTYDEAGTYTVSLTIDEGCTVTEEIQVGTSSTSEVISSHVLEVYPNPASGVINLELVEPQKGQLQLLVINPLGKAVLQDNISGSGTSTIDVSSLAGGMYMIRVASENREVIHMERVMIAR